MNVTDVNPYSLHMTRNIARTTNVDLSEWLMKRSYARYLDVSAVGSRLVTPGLVGRGGLPAAGSLFYRV